MEGWVDLMYAHANGYDMIFSFCFHIAWVLLCSSMRAQCLNSCRSKERKREGGQHRTSLCETRMNIREDVDTTHIHVHMRIDHDRRNVDEDKM